MIVHQCASWTILYCVFFFFFVKFLHPAFLWCSNTNIVQRYVPDRMQETTKVTSRYSIGHVPLCLGATGLPDRSPKQMVGEGTWVIALLSRFWVGAVTGIVTLLTGSLAGLANYNTVHRDLQVVWSVNYLPVLCNEEVRFCFFCFFINRFAKLSTVFIFTQCNWLPSLALIRVGQVITVCIRMLHFLRNTDIALHVHRQRCCMHLVSVQVKSWIESQ